MAEPIGLVTRLADVPVALKPASIFSGDLGSVQPGAANAVFRTNVYTATNYVYASASTIVRGKAGDVPVQTGTSADVEVRNPGVKITMHALEKSGLDGDSIERGRDDLDAPLVPATSGDALDTQPEIGSGLIGDGVTPLLFKLEADTKALSVQDDPLKIRLQAVIKGPGRLGGASLQNRLRILKEGIIPPFYVLSARHFRREFVSLPLGTPGPRVVPVPAALQVRETLLHGVQNQKALARSDLVHPAADGQRLRILAAAMQHHQYLQALRAKHAGRLVQPVAHGTHGHAPAPAGCCVRKFRCGLWPRWPGPGKWR